jgi:ABC-type sugar transport system ATPase subunit
MDLCHRVTVMRDGKLVGTVPTEDLTGEELVTMMLGEAPAATPNPGARAQVETVALQIEHLSVGARTRNVSLEAHGGTIYGLAGQVGSGTSDVVRAISGLAPDARGRVRLGDRPVPLGSPRGARDAGIAYVSGDRKGEGLFLGQAIEWNLTATRLKPLSRWGFLDVDALKSVAQRLCGAIGLDADRVREPVLRLSGGNQQKVLLGRCLERDDTRVLLLDEPTRGVDVRGRAEIHALIRSVAAAGAVVIFTSTELEEILHLSDVVVAMRGGNVVSRRSRADVDAHVVLADMTHSDAAEAA